MSQLKIKKGLEEQLLGLVEIHPEMIVWAYRPEWILYSNNNWDINETMGVDTESFLKVMTKMDEETKIEVKEKGLEFKKYNRQRQYTIKYT